MRIKRGTNPAVMLAQLEMALATGRYRNSREVRPKGTQTIPMQRGWVQLAIPFWDDACTGESCGIIDGGSNV